MKKIDGHGRSVRSTIEYLTKDGRALAADYLNCEERSRSGEAVWRQMDRARAILETNGPTTATRLAPGSTS